MNHVKTDEEDFAQRWSWYQIIRELANGDLTRFDEIFKLKLIMVLNDLSYKKELNQLEKKMNNKNTNTKVY